MSGFFFGTIAGGYAPSGGGGGSLTDWCAVPTIWQPTPGTSSDNGVVICWTDGSGVVDAAAVHAVNLADSSSSIAGGYNSILGGVGNNVTGGNGVIAGGNANRISGALLTNNAIVGGTGNLIEPQSIGVETGVGDGHFIGGGRDNLIDSVGYSVIAGGYNNQIRTYTTDDVGGDNIIGGGVANHIYGRTFYSLIVGGNENTIGNAGPYDQDNNTGSNQIIVGGFSNRVNGGASNGIVAGQSNLIDGDGSFLFIGAGTDNRITSGSYSAILAGNNNQITASGSNNFIIGNDCIISGAVGGAVAVGNASQISSGLNQFAVCGAVISGAVPNNSFMHGTSLADGFSVRGQPPVAAPVINPLSPTLDVDLYNALLVQGFVQ